ncbi:dTDP-4-dehydrorhamnose 3,5-epimerase [Cohnella thermotolerans]|uniref:dTDP-4-dehydrorhamnose 3,5-epimerase n=1 Tax=Cohnella thermotolerans TaxID=329858 RepID=UPI0003FEC6A6|nr:dTDP-4-dehydrorhamnose 3,5-epimerase [Cohnella thermotolerans]
MDIRELDLPGCFELVPKRFSDCRGIFVKTFHKDLFEHYGLAVDYKEQYYSCSSKNVLRGLHFQIPPCDHAKLVYCLHGEVADVFVDLRRQSPTYGRYQMLRLSSDEANMIYLPSGIAHGFQVLSDTATLVYNVTSVHSPEHDSGIHWDSLDIPWPLADPIVSERDRHLPAFNQFVSPF